MYRLANIIAHRSQRVGLTEVLLVAAILGFGAFALLTDGRASPEGLRQALATVFGS